MTFNLLIIIRRTTSINCSFNIFTFADEFEQVSEFIKPFRVRCVDKTLLTVIKYVVVLGISIVLLLFSFKGIRLEEIIDRMLEAKPAWLLLSVVASLVAFFSRALRWNMLIEPLGYRPSAANTSAALMVGYFANLAFPRLGEVTRCGTLNRAEKVPFDSLIGTVIIERIIDVLCLLVCIILVAVIEIDRLGNFVFDNVVNPISEKLVGAIHSPVFIGIVVILIIILCWYFLRRRKNTNTVTGKIAGFLTRMFSGIATVRKLRNPLMFLFHTLLIWLMYFLMSYFCFFALSETASLDWKAGLFVLVAGAIGMSAPVQGGFGTYHYLVKGGLMLYGIAEAPSLTFATLMHGSQLFVVVIFGTFALLYLFLKRRNEAKIT